MNVSEILGVDLDTLLTVFTDSFIVHSKDEVALEGGEKRMWLFSDNDLLLSINAEAEEMIVFRPYEAEIEKDDNMVVLSGKDYEFSYEDRGTVESVDGSGLYEESDEIEFVDYEADDGARVRIITNTFNGEEKIFTGEVVTEDDVIINS